MNKIPRQSLKSKVFWNMLGYEDYEDYLNSKAFKEKRDAVFSRDKNKCKICGAEKNLVAHHIDYINVPNESIDTIICICSSCHTAFHYLDIARSNIQEKYQEYYDSAIEESEKLMELKHEEEKKKKELLYKQFIDEIEKDDYCKGGSVNFLDYKFYTPAIEKFSNEHQGCYISSSDVTRSIIKRRVLLIDRAFDKGVKIEKLLNVGISKKMIDKYYGNKEAVNTLINNYYKEVY